ncbi:MAG: 4Fe-4S binding protein [Gemmatimonadota bacterium]
MEAKRREDGLARVQLARFYQGTLNTIHPAAIILVIIALAMAFLLRKPLCSRVCPVGFSSWTAWPRSSLHPASTGNALACEMASPGPTLR